MTDRKVPAPHASASDYFGAMSDSYDSLIHRAVPRYDEMVSRLLDYLPRDAGRILELGCGTGNLSLGLALRFPGAALTLVDASAEMIAVTRRRLDAARFTAAARPEFVVARFEDLEFSADSLDLVVSSISLHHVENKGKLYERIRAMLRLGGGFAFADQIRGEPEANHDLNWRSWIDFCRAPGHCTPEEITSLLDHAAAHDHYTTLSNHFTLLSRAGFSKVDCVWRHSMWGIVTATAA